MRRPSSIETFTPSPNVRLHPTLLSVLDNLDVQIEEELNRYRRQRRNPNPVSRRRPLAVQAQSGQARPQDATAIGILKERIQLPTPRSSIYDALPAPQVQPIKTQQPAHQPQAQQPPQPLGNSQEGFKRNFKVAEQIPGSPTQTYRQPPFEPTSELARTQSVFQSASQSASQPVSARPTRSEPTRTEPVAFQQPADPWTSSELATVSAVPDSSGSASDGNHTDNSNNANNSNSITSYGSQYDLSAYAPNSTLQRLMQQAEAAQMSTGQTSYQSLYQNAAQATEEETYGDYLASSEELLRSIAEEDPRRAEQEPNSLLDTLLTPLGVGSMLLLLLSSTTLGYVMMNPTVVGLSGQDSAQPVTETIGEEITSSTGRSAGGAGTVPSPDLAANEFIELGLDTLSTIPGAKLPRGTASTQAKSSQTKTANQTGKPAVSQSTTSSNSALPELPPAPVPQPNMATVVIPAQPPVTESYVPAPVYTPQRPAQSPVQSPAQGPAQSPAQSPVQPSSPAQSYVPAPVPVSPEPIRIAPPRIDRPAPTAASSTIELTPEYAPDLAPEPAASSPAATSESTGRYYVVTDYSGDPSLEAARDVVPDAYVRNIPSEGAKVQMGAFSDQTKAQELQQQLQQQGIEAEVYQP